MFKYLHAIELIEDNNGDNTKGINICLEQELIKYVDKEDAEPLFLVLDKNLEKVKEVLKEDYNKISEYDLLGWIRMELTEATHSIELENIYGNKIEVTSEDMFDVIYDDLDICIDEEERMKIYESDNPREELKNILNELGRNELQNRLEDFKDRLDNAIFK
ncbi:hypothetical protein [Clostridium beijerinckii]|uniref:hypothetical protein n=1 Tax=Clostridium beijerinckii TaxID=1520 RepID=UPI00156E6ED4|nr:hypothetical protein [Clostridium beijerinckii]NRU52471.1 hypothetical protein [Clostridium beijerinckii]NYC69084.1 hypothetical protein [Clostridium beijerinckii]NYC91670.1 hypothetical protein [Clostridium beijerinckii]NYC91672.1 hypothetical protein [Clostridium beijerinckii]